LTLQALSGGGFEVSRRAGIGVKRCDLEQSDWFNRLALLQALLLHGTARLVFKAGTRRGSCDTHHRCLKPAEKQLRLTTIG
jgi:hypothetical protein